MVGGESGHKLTMDDALAYLQSVKDLFHDKREKYDEFLGVLMNFSAQRVDRADLIATVKELFKGQPMLILGFNTFLKKGYEITLQAEDEQLPLTKQELISFLNKVKARFKANDGVYKSFCNIFIMYESNPISDIYQEVATLFGHHKDLLVEFTHLASARRVMRPTNSDKKNPVVTSHPDHDLGTEHLDVVPERPLTKESREQILGDDKSNEHRDARDRTNNEILNRDFKTHSQKDQFLNNKQELHIRGNDLAEFSIAESLWNEGKYPQANTSLDNDVERERDEGFRDRDHEKEKERLKKAAASRKWAKPISELDLSNCEQCILVIGYFQRITQFLS